MQLSDSKPTEQLVKDLQELNRIKQEFPRLMAESLKDILIKHGSPIALDNEIVVKTDKYEGFDKILEVSYDPELDAVMLDKQHYFVWQNLRKRFIIYIDVLEKLGYPTDVISDIFYRFYDC